MKDIEKLMDEYAGKFNEPFPWLQVEGTEEEIAAMIEKSIKDGKPVEIPDRGPGVVY